MKGYIIINNKGLLLHSNNYFYDCIMGGFGCNLVKYKNQKSAEKRAQKVGGIVAEFSNGESVREVIKRALNTL
jgi:hypothetical protein